MDRGPPLESIFNFTSGPKTRPQTICETGALDNPRMHALDCGHFITTRGLCICTPSCQQVQSAATSSSRPLAKAFVCPGGTCMKKVAQQEAANIRKTKRDPRVYGLVHVWGLDPAADEKQRLYAEQKRRSSTSGPWRMLVTEAEVLRMGVKSVAPRGVNFLRQVVPEPQLDTDMDSWDLNTVISTSSTAAEPEAEDMEGISQEPPQELARQMIRTKVTSAATTTALGARRTLFLDDEETDKLAERLAETTMTSFSDGTAFRVNERGSGQYYTFDAAPSEQYWGLRPVAPPRPREVELNRRHNQRASNRERRKKGSAMGYNK